MVQSPSLICSTVFSRHVIHLKKYILKHWDKFKDREEATHLYDKSPLFVFHRDKKLIETVTSGTLVNKHSTWRIVKII